MVRFDRIIKIQSLPFVNGTDQLLICPIVVLLPYAFIIVFKSCPIRNISILFGIIRAEFNSVNGIIYPDSIGVENVLIPFRMGNTHGKKKG